MASKRQFRRSRLRRALFAVGFVAAGFGLVILFSAGSSVVHHDAGGLPGVAIGAGLLFLGLPL